jgi:hypothetical protein
LWRSPFVIALRQQITAIEINGRVQMETHTLPLTVLLAALTLPQVIFKLINIYNTGRIVTPLHNLGVYMQKAVGIWEGATNRMQGGAKVTKGLRFG